MNNSRKSGGTELSAAPGKRSADLGTDRFGQGIGLGGRGPELQLAGGRAGRVGERRSQLPRPCQHSQAMGDEPTEGPGQEQPWKWEETGQGRSPGSEQRGVWGSRVDGARPGTMVGNRPVKWGLTSTARALSPWASAGMKRLEHSPEAHGRLARVPAEEMPWVRHFPSLCRQSPGGQRGHQEPES